MSIQIPTLNYLSLNEYTEIPLYTSIILRKGTFLVLALRLVQGTSGKYEEWYVPPKNLFNYLSN